MKQQDYLYNLGLDLYYGRNGKVRNLSKAAETFLEAAELGHPYATAYYAHMLYWDDIEPEDDWHIWEQKAAEMGCKFAEAFILEKEAEGQFDLDDLLYSDPIDPAIKERITQLMKEDADKGFLLSICRLAEDCEAKGAYKEEAEWSLKAAAQGAIDGYWRLGLLYYYGQGIEKSYEKAVECFTNYAKVKYESGCIEYPLSRFEKRGYPKIDICFFFAELGSGGAQSDAGYYHYFGEGIEQSYEKAVEWFAPKRLAADCHSRPRNGTGGVSWIPRRRPSVHGVREAVGRRPERLFRQQRRHGELAPCGDDLRRSQDEVLSGRRTRGGEVAFTYRTARGRLLGETRHRK